MKRSFPLTLLTATFCLSPLVKGEEKPASAPPQTEAKEAAADGWEALESMLQGPQEKPQSREEAVTIYKKYLEEFDEKSAAYVKANPADAHRWDLKLHQVKLAQMREFAGSKALSAGEIKQALGEILVATDATEETKALASFIRVMSAQSDPAEFKQLAEAHTKAYPTFPGNAELEGQLQAAETEKALKEKPLELSFKSTAGQEVDVARLRGKVVLIDFWATWCGPCVNEIPNVVATYNKLHDQGFEIVGISFDKDEAKLKEMTKAKKMPWQQYFDGQGWENKFGKQYGIHSIPSMWLIDKKGMVVDTMGREDLEQKVKKLLAE